MFMYFKVVYSHHCIISNKTIDPMIVISDNMPHKMINITNYDIHPSE